jgi:integrase
MLVMRAVPKPENTVDDRPKNFLTEAEVENFLKAGRKGRHKVRNFAMLLLAFRHGLRVSELINMRMADVDLDTGRLFVRRLKGSLSTSQPLEGDEIRALRAWLRERINAPCCNSPLVFLSERGPMTRQAFNYICAEVAKRAGLNIKVHPHMLRHSCGYALANKACDLH